MGGGGAGSKCISNDYMSFNSSSAFIFHINSNDKMQNLYKGSAILLFQIIGILL